MACTVIHGGDPVATGYKWCSASRPAVMRILQERLDRYLNPTSIVQPEPPRNKTCAELFAAFVETKFPNMHPDRRHEYDRDFDVVPGNYDCTRMDDVRSAVREAVSKKSIHTKRRILSVVRTVFRFGIENGYLTVNPVNIDMLPDVPKGVRKVPFTDEETRTIFEYIEKTPRFKVYASILDITAARPVEIDRLERRHVFEDHIMVYSYKGTKRGATPELDDANRIYRVIPYEVCAGLRELIDECLDSEWTSNTMVFKEPCQKHCRTLVGEAFGKTSRGLYGFRKRRINKWIREGMPDKVRLAIAGHEEDIADDYYVVPFTAEELVGMMSDSKAGKGTLRTMLSM